MVASALYQSHKQDSLVFVVTCMDFKLDRCTACITMQTA
jgi:hypothetical protein